MTLLMPPNMILSCASVSVKCKCLDFNLILIYVSLIQFSSNFSQNGSSTNWDKIYYLYKCYVNFFILKLLFNTLHYYIIIPNLLFI